ncbi:hypothetical protein RCH06_002429 [Polaromonas sp. CG_9.5]|nr:hypothetical protein [Polaromonas sp. CG_9.5]
MSNPGTQEAFLVTPLYREFSHLAEFGSLPMSPPPGALAVG